MKAIAVASLTRSHEVSLKRYFMRREMESERNHTGVIKFLFAAAPALLKRVGCYYFSTNDTYTHLRAQHIYEKAGGVYMVRRHLYSCLCVRAGKAARNQQVVACWEWNTSRFDKRPFS